MDQEAEAEAPRPTRIRTAFSSNPLRQCDPLGHWRSPRRSSEMIGRAEITQAKFSLDTFVERHQA